MVLPRKKIYEYIEEEQMQQSLKERIECKKSQNSLSEMDIELDEIISLKDWVWNFLDWFSTTQIAANAKNDCW